MKKGIASLADGCVDTLGESLLWLYTVHTDH